MRPSEPALWCGAHDRWEPIARACDAAFDPDSVPWLVPDPDAEGDA